MTNLCPNKFSFYLPRFTPYTSISIKNIFPHLLAFVGILRQLKAIIWVMARVPLAVRATLLPTLGLGPSTPPLSFLLALLDAKAAFSALRHAVSI